MRAKAEGQTERSPGLNSLAGRLFRGGRATGSTFTRGVPLCSWILLQSRFTRHHFGGFALASLAGLWSTNAHAESANTAPTTSCALGPLRAEARAARTWRYTWSGINAGLMVGSFAIAPLVQKEDRPDWIVSGIGSGVTVLATWFFPLRVESAVDELEALPPEQCRAQLAPLSLESLRDERARVTWPWHVLNLGLSAAAGGIIAFGYRHYASGVVTGVVGASLGEAQLFTQPIMASAQPQSQRPVPRLAFVPASGGVPATWTLSVASAF